MVEANFLPICVYILNFNSTAELCLAISFGDQTCWNLLLQYLSTIQPFSWCIGGRINSFHWDALHCWAFAQGSMACVALNNIWDHDSSSCSFYRLASLPPFLHSFLCFQQSWGLAECILFHPLLLGCSVICIDMDIFVSCLFIIFLFWTDAQSVWDLLLCCFRAVFLGLEFIFIHFWVKIYSKN